MNQFHAFKSYFLRMNCNVIFPSTLRSRGDLLTSDFRNITLYAFIFQSRCQVLFLTQSLWTDHRNENPLQWKGLRLRRLLLHGKNNTLFIKEYTPWSSSLCRFFRLLLLLPSWAVVIHTYLNTLLSICIFFFIWETKLYTRPNNK